MIYPDLFKNYPDRKGSDWIRRLPPEELKAFVWIGAKHSDWGRKGGIARAQKAKRDKNGKFTKENS